MKPSTIIKAGFLVGTLDIIAACTQFYIKTGKNPEIVLKYIASALFGKEAMSSGIKMSVVGLLLHYTIAFIFTVFFFWIYPKLKFLSPSDQVIRAGLNIFLTAVLYCLFVWTIMNEVVVPLSKITARPFSWPGAAQAAAILIVCIGLPLSLIASKNKQV